MQPLYTSDSAERKCKSVPTRSSTMSLPSEQRRCARARRLKEARRLSRETQVSLTQMQLSNIVVAAGAISLLLALGCIRGIRNGWRDREFCSDLLQRGLGIGQSKLVAEEGGFGGIAV